MEEKNQRDALRMVQWFLFSVVCYAIAQQLAMMPAETDAGQWPRIQTVLWKCGHLNLGAFMGYWIARTRLGRLTPDSSGLQYLAHAIVLGATMLAFGMAL